MKINLWIVAWILLLQATEPLSGQSLRDDTFHAGAAAVDISPMVLPALRNGGFIEATSDRVDDPLFARSLVLAGGGTTIAICIVDSCMLPTDVCDAIKELVQERTLLPRDRILISATHTHTAPSTMDFCLGTRRDDRYTAQVIPQIARSIVQAFDNIQPAKIGWAVVDANESTNCRRWLTRRDRMGTDPFGEQSVRAMMHPGYLNPDYVCPAGPIDPGLTVLSIASREVGDPICVLGNFSMHYFGAGPGFSSDYFGAVADRLESEFSESPDFVGIMSQGTSGDLHWMDYSQSQRSTNRQQYADAISSKIIESIATIEYAHELTIEMAETRLTIDRRAPNDERLRWARTLNEQRGNRTPRDRPEVYAQQAEWIHENPSAVVVLQAIRIGELGITAMPNEVYGITGLKLKEQSPLPVTFNLELSNGAEGYIPPPSQHELGGYTTWPSRTAGLAKEAEPIIVENLLRMLEELTGTDRRVYHDPSNDFSQFLLESKPIAYWRLGDLDEGVPLDEIGTLEVSTSGTLVRYLSGPDGEGLSSGRIGNRAMYFIEANLGTEFVAPPEGYTTSMWIWNGMPSELANDSSSLLTIQGQTIDVGLTIAGNSDPEYTGRLILEIGDSQWAGTSLLANKAWHYITLVDRPDGVRVYLDGGSEPEIFVPQDSFQESDRSEDEPVQLVIGTNSDGTMPFDGKLDEIALFNRALDPNEIETAYSIADVERPVLPTVSKGFTRKPTDDTSLLEYERAIRESSPIAYWRLQQNGSNASIDLIQQRVAEFENNATSLSLVDERPNFTGGRFVATLPEIGNTYSVEMLIRNDLPNVARPVTGYMFCRGADMASGAPGDSLGIGGTHSWTGSLFVYNGNHREEAVSGSTTLLPSTWNHVVFVREEESVRAYLNGSSDPEFEGTLPITYDERASQFFIGGRNDNFANFQGMIEEASFYDRVLTTEEIADHFLAANLTLVHQETERLDQQPRPTSASDSLERIHVPDGYRVELIASEPLVMDPVAIDWGPDGKLWVVEMADYPLGMDGSGEPGGRIRFLEDTDGDGRYDTSTVFAQGLTYPTGILVWRDGILVTAAPEILYLEDSDGDGVADVNEVLFSGFLEGNQQLRVNGLRWGLDNWVYCASGSHHAGYGADSQITSHRAETLHQVGSRDFRIRPETGQLDPQSGPSQYGRNRDDWGNWFGVQNSHPLWHYALEDHDIRRNPNFAPPNPKRQIITPANPRVYPASQLQKRFHSFEQSGRYTSACSAMIYRDQLLFVRDDRQHAFTCEPFHNLVQHNEIVPTGVSFQWLRSDSERQFDFFASEDRWCRPVMTRTGPDGALWVVDMYRYMIEHPQWLPENGQNELRPYYRLGDQHGRIYRIVPDEFVSSAFPMHGRLSTEELVVLLGSSNGWVRDTAQRMIVQQDDPIAAELLVQQYHETDSALAHLHILCTLDGLGHLPADLVRMALSHEHAGVRRHAVRLAAGFPFDQTLIEMQSIEFEEPVIQQLAITLGAFHNSDAANALASIAFKYHDHEYIFAAAMSSLHELTVAQVFRRVSELVFQDEVNVQSYLGLLDTILAQSVANGNHDALVEVVSFAIHFGGSSHESERDRLLARVLFELEKKEIELESLPTPVLEGIQDRVALARTVIERANATAERRAAAIRLLLFLPSSRDADLALLQENLQTHSAIVMQEAILERCSQVDDPVIADLVTQSWESYSPALRDQIVSLLSSRESWSRSLLQQIEAGKISIQELGPAQRANLIQSASNDTRDRWQSLMDTARVSARTEIVERYRDALDLEHDLALGETLFSKHCATCHRYRNVGNEIGPDLVALTDRTDEKLITSILDPSSSVEAKYLSYVVVDKQGRVHTGIISVETASSLTLRTSEGESESILRSEIEEIRSTGLSLMPNGLEDELSLQDMANIIRFVQEMERQED